MTDYIANGIGRNLLICHVIRVTLGLYEIQITEYIRPEPEPDNVMAAPLL